ncbi:MAG: ADOP family duplicated permease [Myxococcales bacterium]
MAFLRTIFHRREVEAELDEEIAFHLRQAEEELIARGVPPEEARVQARREFGGVEQHKEECRDERGTAAFDGLCQDLRFALRSLRRNRGFAIVAVLSLALGIGAATAVFSVVHAVLLRPLPYPHPERLVRVWNSWTETPDARLSVPELLDYRARVPSVQLAGYAEGEAVIALGDERMRLHALAVTSGYFEILGVVPVLGRTFAPEEEREGHPVAILSYALAQRLFGGSSAAGASVTLDGAPFTVVGVLPRSFVPPDELGAAQASEIFLPLGYSPADVAFRGSHFLRAIGRLRDATGVAAASSSLDAVARSFRPAYPDSYPEKMRFAARAVPLASDLTRAVAGPLLLLFAAVVAVLLLVCANLAVLLLARAESRQSELAIRAALGAGAGRLVRLLVTESLLLALLGGVGGAILAGIGVTALLSLAPADLPRLSEVAVRLPVPGFALGSSLLVGLAVGIFPAFQAVRGGLRETASRTVAARGRLRRGLVVSEVALSLLLLLGAGLLARSFSRLLEVDPGFDPRGVLSVSLTLPDETKRSNEEAVRFFRDLDARVSALPGAIAVGSVQGLPLASRRGDLNIEIEGREKPADTPRDHADWQVVTPGYRAAMGMRLLRGRDLLPSDDASAPGAVLVNESMVRRYFPGEDPIGKRFTLGAGSGPGKVTVVGVVADVRQASLDADPKAEMYLAHAQFTLWTSKATVRSMNLVVRASGNPALLARPIRDVLASLEPRLVPGPFRTMGEVRSASVARPRFALVLVGLFSAAALVIAIIGVYGVTSYSVVRRTREIGIRLALGAVPSSILRLVAREGAALSACGIVIGLVLWTLVSRALAGMLFGVTPMDALTLVQAGAVLAFATVLAGFFPARRATRVDPTVAMRTE